MVIFWARRKPSNEWRLDYIYPRLGDRSSPEEWEERGSKDVWQRARERVEEVLCEHYPSNIDPKVDDQIRDRFNILLPRDAMERGNGRW